MVREIPGCSYNDLIREIDADAEGKECVLYDLRERGRMTVKFVSVTAERIYFKLSPEEKRESITVKTLHNKLTNAKKAV